ncbi:MbnP family protein [Portibacter marinus]|uniref:MbnP family protein n=1 Tax=Portibacter marinus TaxID=2898660 RepID=UPI001F321C24|nr:MbnP family protein [Portibacter marinus]
MRKILLIAAIAAVLTSCKEEGMIEFNIIPLYDGQSVELNEAVQFGDMQVRFENLALYMTDISIVNNGEQEYALSELELIQLSDGIRGQTILYEEVPGGNYSKLKFNVGITEDLNAQSPGDFSVEEPLGRTDFYWVPWNSYIFSKTEGSADPDGDGVFDLKWFYHTGSDALLRSLSIDIDLAVDQGASSILALSIDYGRLLSNEDGSRFDIVSKPRNHNPDDTEIIKKLVDNYKVSIKEEF